MTICSFKQIILMLYIHVLTLYIHENTFTASYDAFPINKVGCVAPMVTTPIFLQAEFGPNDHREDRHDKNWLLETIKLFSMIGTLFGLRNLTVATYPVSVKNKARFFVNTGLCNQYTDIKSIFYSLYIGWICWGMNFQIGVKKGEFYDKN